MAGGDILDQGFESGIVGHVELHGLDLAACQANAERLLATPGLAAKLREIYAVERDWGAPRDPEAALYAELAKVAEKGLEPRELEKAKNNPYANILVTTPQLQDDPRIRQLAKDLRSPEVAKYITDNFAGSVIPVAGGKP